jgi:uncharacterized membrane protein YdbT with pleckstrin-like domain
VGDTHKSIQIEDPPSDFGIRLLDEEVVLFSRRPYRFYRYAAAAVGVTIIGIPLIPLALLWALLARRRYHYWLTNKRVVWCHGFIGYRVRSVPLERVADVVISRTLPELVAGMSSIVIRDMTGQTQMDMGARWIGVEDAPDVQKRILEEIRRVNSTTGRI